MTATRCPGRMRHWRIAFGTVGMRTPVCVFCGDPNPRPLSDQEWIELIDWIEHGGPAGRHVKAAIAAYQRGQKVISSARAPSPPGGRSAATAPRPGPSSSSHI